MDIFSSEVFNALRLLCPGFVAAWVLASLTVDGKKSDLQRVIQALIFSVFVQILLFPTKYIALWLGTIFPAAARWSPPVELAWSVVLGLLIGCVSAWLVDSDKLYALLRKAGITKQSSRPSVWYSAFNNFPRYVVLHLEDGRRIYGWPDEWSSRYPHGHVRLIDAAWLNVDKNDLVDLSASELILIRVKDVRIVEFIKPAQFSPKPEDVP